MGDEFKKFKRRIQIEAIVKSALIALAAGLFPVGVLLLCFKLTATPFHPAFYVLIGAGVAAAVFAGVFFLLRPTDEAVAKRIDGALSLREKTQTMVAFREKEGDLVSLQREDARACLAKASPKAVKFRALIFEAVACVLALLCLFTGVFIPAKATDEEFVVTPWLETALNNLIEEVKSSGMEEGAKTPTVGELETLTVSLKSIEYQGEMKALVVPAIEHVDKIVTDVNSNDELAETLVQCEDARLRDLGASVRVLSSAAAEGQLRTIGNDLKASENLSSDLRALSRAINEALTNSVAPETDALYVALSNFSKDLLQIESYGDDAAALIDGALDRARPVITAVAQQAVNKSVGDMVHSRLVQLFGIEEEKDPNDPDVPENPDNPENPGTDPDKNKDPNEGSAGRGELEFGSDDIVYDPIANEFVKYGEIFNRYYSAVLERMVDGEIPEDLEEYIAAYYAALLKGTTDEKE